MFQKILIPLDGSEVAEAILPYLGEILRRSDSEILLLEVAQPPVLPPTMSYVPYMDFEEPARLYIRGVQARLEGQGVRTRGLVRLGPPAGGILEAAEEEQVGMIALSTHGRSGIARWVFGSVAEKVIRSSPVPVLVVRAALGGKVPPPALAPDPILVSLDGSENSLAVVPHAIAFAKFFKARVTLLRVHEPVESPEPPTALERAGAAPKFSPPGRLPYGRTAVQHALRQFTDAGVDAKVVEASGDPASEILAVAHRSGARLIAMATHGRSGPARWMLGSVAEKVLRASNLPILLARVPNLQR